MLPVSSVLSHMFVFSLPVIPIILLKYLVFYQLYFFVPQSDIIYYPLALYGDVLSSVYLFS